MKRVKIIAVTMALACWTVPAKSETYYMTGNKILNDCLANKSQYRQGFCDGYIIGQIDLASGLSFAKIIESFYCIPKTVTIGQLGRIVEKHLVNNPDKLHQIGSAQISVALVEAFPCK